jgi:hypothetical protein
MRIELFSVTAQNNVRGHYYEKFDVGTSFVQQTQGNVGIIFAICSSVLVIGLGVAIDTNRLVSTDQKLQDAVDAATLYAAKLTDDADFQATAQQFLIAKTDALEIENMSSSFARSGDEVTRSASGKLPLAFGGLLNRDKSGVSANTVVKLPRSAPCIIALSRTKSPGFLLNMGAKVESTGCEVHVHSTGAPSVTVNVGTTLDVVRTCMAGRNILNHSGASRIEPGCVPAADPYAGIVPVPNSASCDFNGQVFDEEFVTSNPGVYCGSINFQNPNMKVTMNPGLYVIRGGDWNVNGGDWDGDGVTFYNADDSKVQFNGSVKARLTAPETGPYAGVFMADAPGISGADFIINDNRGFDFDGIIHLPSRQIILNGGSTIRARQMAIVGDTIIINTAKLNLSPVGSSGNAGRFAYISR